MTEPELVAHWRKRAREKVKAAQALHAAGYHADALFHCHLAIERRSRRQSFPLFDFLHELR